jgi:acyl-coenzyme A thioesterase 13
MSVHKNFFEVMSKFALGSIRAGSYAELIDRGFSLIEHHKLIQNERQVLLLLKVLPEFCNQHGTIHGGALCTILDCATAFSTLKVDKKMRTNVSVELNFSFLNPAKLGDNLLIRAETLNLREPLAETCADIFIENSLVLVGTGTHLQMLINKRFDE